MFLSTAELALAAAACRALAGHYRGAAKRYKRPNVRDDALARARRAERLAEAFERERVFLN